MLHFPHNGPGEFYSSQNDWYRPLKSINDYTVRQTDRNHFLSVFHSIATLCVSCIVSADIVRYWLKITNSLYHILPVRILLRCFKSTWVKRMAITNGTCMFLQSAHFGLPWVRPGTIAVNFTWMERGFNACQTHRSMYLQPSSTIARYWSEIATFSYPLAFNAPVGCVPIGIPEKYLVLRKLESWGYQAVKTVWR